MFVPLLLPITILPRVIAELWSVFQHLLGDVSSEAIERRVVMELDPWRRLFLEIFDGKVVSGEQALQDAVIQHHWNAVRRLERTAFFQVEYSNKMVYVFFI